MIVIRPGAIYHRPQGSCDLGFTKSDVHALIIAVATAVKFGIRLFERIVDAVGGNKACGAVPLHFAPAKIASAIVGPDASRELTNIAGTNRNFGDDVMLLAGTVAHIEFAVSQLGFDAKRPPVKRPAVVIDARVALLAFRSVRLIGPVR